MPKRTREERNSGFYDEKAERMDRAERAAFKEKEAIRILRYAYENAPGYKKFLDERGIDPGSGKKYRRFLQAPRSEEKQDAGISPDQPAVRGVSCRAGRKTQTDLCFPRSHLRSGRKERGLLGAAEMPVQCRIPAGRYRHEHLLLPPDARGYFSRRGLQRHRMRHGAHRRRKYRDPGKDHGGTEDKRLYRRSLLSHVADQEDGRAGI